MRKLLALHTMPSRRISLTIMVLMIVGGFACAQAGSQDYDLVILNGRVMDPETNFDAVANVGIRDGRIAVITDEAISGEESIDATGHVVAPGFIDTHNHWQRTMGYKIALRDGVTTSFDLEFGTVGSRVDEWYAERDGESQANYGTASSHEGARSEVIDQCAEMYDAPGGLDCRAKYNGWAETVPTLEQGN